MGQGKIILGGVQMAGLREQKDHNFETAVRLIRRAAKAGAQIIMTPEAGLSGYVGGPAERNMAEPVPGPATQALSELAQELNVYILFGMTELRDGEFYNAMPVISPAGDLMGVMRKVHINRYETGGGWRNGSDFPVWTFTTPTGQMTAGIMICYDREHPESARLLMLQGADVIFNPLACGCPTDDIHRCLLRTRAFENECYIFMVNHAAPAQNGHSMAFDYMGTIREELQEGEDILLYEVDLDALVAHREGPHSIYGIKHRRPELYGPLSDPAGQSHPEDANLPEDR